MTNRLVANQLCEAAKAWLKSLEIEDELRTPGLGDSLMTAEVRKAIADYERKKKEVSK